MPATAVFIHGLESSSHGTKAQWLKNRFPDMLVSDFRGSLCVRMAQLDRLLAGRQDLILVGSSFGGLMAAVYALENERRLSRVVLLAPALNFREFGRYRKRSTGVPCLLYAGRHDSLCPLEKIIPPARDTFTDLSVHITDDDHFLRTTFPAIDWLRLLQG